MMASARNMLGDEQVLNSRYEIFHSKLIGEGTYGKVYKARNKTTGREVALKKMPYTFDQNTDEECIPSTYLREIALLKAPSTRHPHIVELIDVFVVTSKVWLVFEFIDTDLRKFMKLHGCSRVKGLNHDLVQRFSYHLCRGIEHMHTKLDMIHRDLKPQNLLITRQHTLKLADYGLARRHGLKENAPHSFTPEVVTVWYRAPELLLGSAVYNTTLDLWSTGCIIAEMAIGEPLFGGDSEIGTIVMIFQLLGTPSEATLPGITTFPHFSKFSPMWPPKAWNASRPEALQRLGRCGVDLVASLLVYDPRRRNPARKVVKHVFFEGVEPPVQRQLMRTITPVQDKNGALLEVETPEKLSAETQSSTKAAAVFAAFDKKRNAEVDATTTHTHSSVKHARVM